jgi:NhaA family Na+:H+ antiporter
MESTPIRDGPPRLAPLLRPVQAFLAAESAGGVTLMLSMVVALVWSNSRWGDAYRHFWHAPLSIGLAGRTLSLSLAHWVNDGLMVVFFLLVGLEIKRELLIGELATRRRAALPLAAAIGGMILPALIYAALNARGAGAAGWGIPMATDIAFAVGVLALVGRSVPGSVKVFLLAVAIVDDLGAVLVIAAFYSAQLSTAALLVAGAFLAGLVALNRLRVHAPMPYVLLGIGLWAATLCSGVHPTIAGVLLAFTIPATRLIEERPYVEHVRGLLARFERGAIVEPDRITEDQSHALKSMEEASQAVQTPLARVEHALLRPVNFLIVPLFALANAGVGLRAAGESAVSNPVAWGVLLGLLLGKPAGVLLASWAAVRSGVASMPAGTNPRQFAGIAVLCGIGFTMSLFVANLAFGGDEEQIAAARVGILLASLVCGVAGGALVKGPSSALTTAAATPRGRAARDEADAPGA